jgi:hypothetical protein
MHGYDDACKRAATDQGLDPLTREALARKTELENAGVSYGVEQTGGFTMVACFYLGGDVVTCTNEGDWIVCVQTVEEWTEQYTGAFEDLSTSAQTPRAIVDTVLSRAAGQAS